MSPGRFVWFSNEIAVKGFEEDIVSIAGEVLKVSDQNLQEVSAQDRQELSPGKKKRLRRLFLVYKNYVLYWPSWDRKTFDLIESAIQLVRNKKMRVLQQVISRELSEEIKVKRAIDLLVSFDARKNPYEILQVEVSC